MGSGLLETIKKVVRKEAYTEGRIMEAILANQSVVKDLYKDFESRHQVGSPDLIDSRATEELAGKIQKTVSGNQRILPSYHLGELDRHILKSFLTFNKQILKTNFYKRNKVALSFRFVSEHQRILCTDLNLLSFPKKNIQSLHLQSL